MLHSFKICTYFTDYCSQEEVIFWDTTPFSNNLSQYDILLMITKEEIPDINVSHLEDVYILLILSKNHSNIISTEYSTILKQNFDDEKFILMKKVRHQPLNFKFPASLFY